MGSHSEHSSMRVKFQVLFDKINEPNYVMDTYYSDHLIHKIEESRKDHHYIYSLTHLLVEPIQNLEKYHASVQVFLVRVLAFCVSKELYFAKILSNINAQLRKAYSDIGSPMVMMPSLSVAYLEVALSLVEQNTGLSWLIESGMWKEILSPNNESRTVFVTRQKYKFVTRLVWRLNSLEDDDNLKDVLNFILKPLFEKELMVTESITADEEEELSKHLEPTLYKLQSILNDYNHLTRSSLVLDTLINHFKLVTHLCVLLDRFRKDSLMSLISKLIFRLLLAKVLYSKPLTDDTIYTAEDFIETSAVYFNTVNLFLTRRNAMLVLDYCYSCNETWNGIWHNRKPNMSTLDGKKVDLQNKILFLCIVPAFAYITRHIYGEHTPLQKQACIRDYIVKLIQVNCEHTAKAAMILGQVTMELDTETVVLQSVKRLSSLVNSVNSEQANLMFQELFYVLQMFDPENQEQKTPEVMFQEDQEDLIVYTYIIEAIFLLVKTHDITWSESLEVICLYNVVYRVLKKPNLSNKVSLQVILNYA